MSEQDATAYAIAAMIAVILVGVAALALVEVIKKRRGRR